MKKGKKRRFKKSYLIAVHLAVALVIAALLLYRPARYGPLRLPPGSHNPGQLSPYLTNELLPQFYNGVQRGEPFDLIVDQNGINDIVVRYNWPMYSEGATLSAPEVLFLPGYVMLMGTATVKGVDLVVTIVVEPTITEKGLLSLRLGKVNIGAMNITPLAKVVAARMYKERIMIMPPDEEDIRTQIAASLLNDQAFEPVFNIRDIFENKHRMVRVEKISVEKERVVLRLVPSPP